MPGMKSIRGPIQLKGLTIVNSNPFSAPSAVNNTIQNQHMKIESLYTKSKKKKQLTIDQPLNQLLSTGI